MRFSVILTLLVLATSTVTAQPACRPDPTAPRVVYAGSVNDSSGAPIAGAGVTLRCGNLRLDGRTSGDGTYRISAPSGSSRRPLPLLRFFTVPGPT